MRHQAPWESHWNDLRTSAFGKFSELYRKSVRSKSVRYYINRYFPDNGIFVECGSGTSQTSVSIEKRDRTLIAIDISKGALQKAKDVKTIDALVNADIFSLPFRKNSVDGIWNLGVMEHFNEEELKKAFREFHRVVKPGAYVILYWPPLFGLSEIVLGAVERFHNLISRRKLQFFPDEITHPVSKAHMRKILSSSGFAVVDIHFDFRDLFNHYVAVCRKL
jgi:ubiquinone/menaquinone biosynthesis C-methylase UbiE